MRKYITILLIASLAWLNGCVFSNDAIRNTGAFERAEDHRGMIPTKIVRKIKLPKGYHEGLLFHKDTIWVNNGQEGKTWVVDLASGKVTSEIEPVGTFSEGITEARGGRFWLTDWDAKKLYLVRIEKSKMIAESELSLAPSHPAGVVSSGSYLYVIIWTRVASGTRYHLLKMDQIGNIIEKKKIKGIPEPTQLAWDGSYLWISSWFDRRVYKIDPETYEIKGYFRSGVKKLTGITWDGKNFWMTGTRAGLYKIELKE